MRDHFFRKPIWEQLQQTESQCRRASRRRPKHRMQTPQRKRLRGPLREWADAQIRIALDSLIGALLDKRQVEAVWKTFCGGDADNSFYIWQRISMGLMFERNRATLRTPEQAALFAG